MRHVNRFEVSGFLGGHRVSALLQHSSSKSYEATFFIVRQERYRCPLEVNALCNVVPVIQMAELVCCY